MDAACLKIKFTSLIKKLQKDDSKCCLEIVPEVTYFQNFDTILRKQESNFYEYIIPMTYKIILKKGKKYDRKCMDVEVNQVYHSCVDLLRTASSSADEAGDIPRMFSETMLLSKVTNHLHTSNMIVTQPRGMYSNIESKVTASAQTYEKRDEFTLTGSNNSNVNKPNNNAIRIYSEKGDCVTRNIDIQVDSLENIINVVKELVEKSTQNQSNQRVDLIVNHISTKSNVPRPILSLTPICSINTGEAFETTNYAINSCNPNSITKYDYKDIYYYNYLAPIIKTNMYTSYMPYDNFKHLEPYKHTPEVRIAKFMKLMEDEILPLKCMLNDIVSKFMSLNMDKQLIKTLLETKKVKQFQTRKPQCRKRSNRVIYTIVFDG